MLNDLRDTFGYRISELFFRKFCSEYQTVYDAFITKPPNSVARDHDIMVRGMVKDGDWQTKDIFYIPAAQTAVDSLWNWINPGTHDLTVVNLAAGQFEIYRGWTGNGVNGYLDTNYNPFTQGVNYLQNDASAGVYIRTNIAENAFDFGVKDGANNRVALSARWSDNNSYQRINDDTADGIVNVDSRGFYILNRNAANSKTAYRNKAIYLNVATASTGLPNHNIYILANNENGVLGFECTKQIAAFFGGGGMTQTNVNNFDDRLVTFLTAIGAAV